MGGANYKIYPTSKTAWDAMYQSIRDAKKSVYWEIYILVDDEAGGRFFDLLEKKAREGLDVKLIVDYLGSFSLSRKKIMSLKSAGVDIRFFINWRSRWVGAWRNLLARTHKKVLIIDEKKGFIGGVNIQRYMRDWWDIQISIQGKVVNSLLRAFAKSYILSGGERTKVEHLLKYRFRIKKNGLEFLFDEAHNFKRRTWKRYTESIMKARERIILFSPYYFPDRVFLKELWEARKRGVKVDLLIPFRSDLRIATYAFYAVYSLMEKIGVNIHFTDKMMHGKGMIVDDDLAIVGSSNLDLTSFYLNYEASVQFKNKRFIKKLKRTVERWLPKTKNLNNSIWKNLGWRHAFKVKLSVFLFNLLYLAKVKDEDIK